MRFAYFLPAEVTRIKMKKIPVHSRLRKVRTNGAGGVGSLLYGEGGEDGVFGGRAGGWALEGVQQQMPVHHLGLIKV